MYTREALDQWVSMPEARLEQLERLEQLRPLAAGIAIGVAVVDQAEGGVDTLADVNWLYRVTRGSSKSSIDVDKGVNALLQLKSNASYSQPKRKRKRIPAFQGRRVKRS